jgi:hypothetical protein
LSRLARSGGKIAMQSRALAFALALVAGAAPLRAEPPPYAVSNARRPEALPREKGATTPAAQPIELPPLPGGVEELKFAEFFQLPVGPHGLATTERLRALDGKRVRILGHMVREDLTPCNSCPKPPRKDGKRPPPAWMEHTVPGRMMLAPQPAMVSHAHYGLADDLPPQTLFVTVPDKFGELVPFTPGPMLLTGVLSVGNKPEADGRISVVRLTLDPPAKPSLSATPQPVNQTP